VIAKGLITRRANDERLPAQTIERDYVLAHICADIGTAGDGSVRFFVQAGDPIISERERLGAERITNRA
jgi:hypothetical protein